MIKASWNQYKNQRNTKKCKVSIHINILHPKFKDKCIFNCKGYVKQSVTSLCFNISDYHSIIFSPVFNWKF